MFKSLRWRLQVWHALVLLIVLTSFGGVVYGLHWRTRLQQVDAELNRVTGLVTSQILSRLLRRPRRKEPIKSETDSVSRLDQTGAARTETTSETDGDSVVRPATEQSSQDNASRELPSREQVSREPAARGPVAKDTAPRERSFPEPSPPPPQFDELFHGDEESRFYYIIWGKDGEKLHQSDSAPDLAYPNLHAGPDGLRFGLPKERRADHIYRELITCVPGLRSQNRGMVQGPQLPNDWNVLVGRSIEKDIAGQHHSGLRLIAIGFVILAAGVLGGGWLSARAIRPIASMTATAESISAQNLTERINVDDMDSEFGELATVFNGSFDRLQAAVERQRQFTADASHELRTPLSVIAAHTELALSRPRSSEDYQATLETCWRASQRMKSLIDSLLLLARFDSGATPLIRTRMNLDSMVSECVELVEPLATARAIRIECQTTSCLVYADSERLFQVVTNLLTNAIRYNVDEGSIHVSIRVEHSSAVISVTDTGVGISPDQLPRIFDRFYQVDKARSRAEGSCGLGLSICKTIVEAHSGAITATSQVNVGTTLEVRLPMTAGNGTSAEWELEGRRLEASCTDA